MYIPEWALIRVATDVWCERTGKPYGKVPRKGSKAYREVMELLDDPEVVRIVRSWK